MNGNFQLLFCIIFILALTGCNNNTSPSERSVHRIDSNNTISDPVFIYRSEKLHLLRLSKHVFQHTSFLQTNDFGKVDCNGMIVVKDQEAVVFDTPADNESAEILIRYLADSMGVKIKAIIPTHFHEDCVGGIEAFEKSRVPVHASGRTLLLLKSNQRKMPDHIRAFTDSMDLPLGKSIVSVRYFGEGHTKDNITGYFSEDQVVFGGCLVKETGAGKGNLADANVKAWPETVRRLKQTYPSARIVIPGHGKYGGTELFDYTIELFQ